MVYSVPNNKILDLSKLKAFSDDNYHLWAKNSEEIENVVYLSVFSHFPT